MTGAAATTDEADRVIKEEIRREVVREALTMALYVSLSLLAVLVALPPATETRGHAAWTVAVTSAGLILAHLIAFRMSSRLVEGGLTTESFVLIGAQLAGGAAVTVLAVLPFAVLVVSTALTVSRILLFGFVAIVGYLTVRLNNGSRLRAFLYVILVAVATAGVVAVKGLVH